MVNKVPKFSVSQHKQQRNAFDLSQAHLIQAAPGLLLPVLSLNLIPDDDITINVEDFVKSMPIVQAPMCSARGVYEFFFVPYHQIWHNFDQFITQMNDYRSSLFATPNPPSYLPQFGTRTHSIGGKSVTTHVGSPLDLSQVTNFPNQTIKIQLSYLYDLLGYCPFLDANGSPLNLNVSGSAFGANSLPDYAPNFFKLCAYEKIYQDYYRKTSYEAFDVTSYSLDSVPSNEWFFSRSIHLRNYGLDLLTNVRPSASLNVNNQKVFRNIVPSMFGTDNYGDLPANYNGLPTSDKDTNTTGLAFYGSGGNTTLSVSSIRAAFALDKLSQIIGRAEKDYKSQMQAVYGTNVTMGRDGKCIFIDGFSSDISFGEVDNTNGDSYAGSYSTYGKVFGNGNGSIHFKSPEFGVLMCIYSIIPFVPYDSTRVDAFNTKHVYHDYFNPLYQRLGLQPLYKYQISATSIGDENPMTSAFGWQPRYSEYKTAIDENHGSFVNKGPLSSFTASRTRGNSYGNGLRLADLKISPNVFDSIFTANYDGTLNSYPFMNKISFNIVKVSSMDTDSLPLI